MRFMRLRRIRIERIQFEAIELRAHLKIKVRVVDSNGAQLAIDSSLRVLQERFCKDEVSGQRHQRLNRLLVIR